MSAASRSAVSDPAGAALDRYRVATAAEDPGYQRAERAALAAADVVLGGRLTGRPLRRALDASHAAHRAAERAWSAACAGHPDLSAQHAEAAERAADLALTA